MVSSTTTEWLEQRPKWLQVIAKRQLESGDLNDAAISDLAVLCQQEANNEFPDFGKNNIVVVYGDNGSGKSGYVRLLNHVCGARDCVRGQLHKNVFSSEDVAQKAKVSFLKSSTPAEHEWTSTGACDDLSSVDIFDTSFGKAFIWSEDEVSYEPPVLSFFSRLINVCERVAFDEINRKINVSFR